MQASDSGLRAEAETIDEHATRRREWAGGWRSVAVPALLVAAIAGLVFFFQARGDAGGAAATAHGAVSLPPGLNPAGLKVDARDGSLAPDFLLADPDGSPLRLSDLRGHPVLVNFWASWCGPCRAEMPEIQSVYDGARASGLVVVAVNVQESAAKVRDWSAPFGLTFPLVLDTDGSVTRAYYADSGLPASFFIDADGRVASINRGQMTRASILAGLRTIGVGGAR